MRHAVGTADWPPTSVVIWRSPRKPRSLRQGSDTGVQVVVTEFRDALPAAKY